MKKLIRPLKWSCVAILTAAFPAVAQVNNTWNGSVDANWSTAGNWSPGLPNPGDNLIFDGSAQTSPNNDLTADTLFNNITFAPTATPFTLGGNRILVQGTIENDATNQLQTIALNLVLTNAVVFNTVSNDLNATSGNDIEVPGAVTGPGSLTKNGNGTLTLANATHSGGTTVNAGRLVVSNNIGNVTLNGGAYIMNFRTYFMNPTISLSADSSIGIDLLDNAEPVGVDIYSTIGTAGYKLTKVGEGLIRMNGSINASSIDVAEGTLASLGGGLGGSISIEPAHKLGTAPITVENGAMLRIDDGGVVQNAITLMGGDGTSVGGSQHSGALRSSARNNGGSATNFNYFANTITLIADSTIGSYYNKMFISGNITGPGGFTKIGSSPLNISGTNDFGGALVVNAGTVQLGSSTALPSGATNSYVQLTGASTLDLNGNNASCNGFIDDGAGTANLDNTAATPATFTVGNNNTSASFFGAVKNTGGGALSLVYNGAGTASFLGVNTYSGSNVVTTSGGTLEINIPTGTTTGGAVAVADGATLSLHYRVSGSSLKASWATFGSSGTTTLNIDLNNYGNPPAPVINATNGSGVLSANGTITINFNNMANVVVGQFPIIKYTSRTGSGSFVLGSLPGGIIAQIVTNTPNKSIDLLVTSSPITTWKGKLTDNNWDTTTTNWTYSGSPVLYTDGSAVLFDNTALTNNVNLTTTLLPSSTLINSSNNYTFSGPGSLASGDLTKNGPGTLILDTANSYNNTVISAGTIQVGANDTIGSLGTGTINDGGTLIFNRSDNLTISSAISGAGSVVQNNTNILTLSSPNAYNGGTVVAQGVLKITDNAALGVSSSPTLVTVSNGATLDIGGKLLTAATPQYVAISGNGVAANKGALATTSGMGCQIGCGIVGVRYLRLLGDATIGDDTGDFQIGADVNVAGPNYGSIDGQGFALTKVGNNTLVLEATNFTALSRFQINGGGVIYGNGGNNVFGSSCPIVISNNAWLDTWDQKSQVGITFANPITIAANGGQLRSTKGSYGGNHNDVYNGSITLNGTLTVLCSYLNGNGNRATMTFNSTISGPGGILCSGGARTVTLAGAMNYTGTTIVSNTGVLLLSANQSGGGAYVGADNATLDIPAQANAAALPMASLTLGSSTGGNLQFSRVSSFPTNTPLVIATNLTLVGNTTVLLPPSVYASPGVYPLLKYTGTVSGGGSLVAGGSGVRGTPGIISNDVATTTFYLVVPGGNPVYWTGSVNNGWDIATTANFLYLGAGTTYQQAGSLGDAVTFDDSSTKTNVFLTTPVAPSVVIANLTNNTYVFAGTNITGASSLVKNGPGTLVLSNLNNNFTGGTFVGGGTLKLATAPGLSGPLNSLSGGTVTVASGATFDQGSNNPTAMILNLSGAGVGGNGAFQANYSGSAQAYGPSVINQIGNLTVGGNNRWDLRNGTKAWNVNSNGATLTKVGAGYIGLVAATISTNLGDITILGGTLDFSTTTTGVGNTNATIYVGNGGNLGFFQFATPVYKTIICSNNAGILVDGGNTVGQNVISGPFVLQGGTTTIKGNFFNGLYVSNAISGPGSLQLQFQSYLYLAASNTFTGTLTVPNCNASNGGRGTRLSFIGNGSAMTCSQIYLQGIASGQAYAGWISMDTPSATLTLGANQQLRGDNGAYIRGSVVVPATANIAPGGINNSNYQYMIVGTNLTFQAGSTNYMDIFKAGALLTNDLIIVSNLVTYGGTLQIRTNGSTALVVGDSFKLFQASSSSGNFANIADNSGISWSFNPTTGIATVTALAPTVNTAPTNIVASVSGNALTLQWPADHTGWFLQSNSVSLVNASAWFNIAGSDTTNKVVLTVDPSKTNVFYRMKY